LPIVARWPNTYVGVRYADLAGGVAWLERVYAFTVREVIGPVSVLVSPGGGVVVVAALEGEPAAPYLPSPSISMAVPDVDRHYERAAAEGATILMPPSDLPWDMRAYATSDIGGHHWQFFQNR
jgi:hypothetical protein